MRSFSTDENSIDRQKSREATIDQRFVAQILSRRRFLTLSLAATGTTLLAACGGDDEGPVATTAPAPTQAAGGTGTGATNAPTATKSTASTAPAASPGAVATQVQGTTANLPKTAAPGKAGGIKTFRVASEPDIQNLDPAKITGAPDYQIGEAIFNFIGRYTYTPPLGTDINPELAEKWEISPDAKVFTFHLRKGVKFHGTYGELTSEDVRWNWARIQDPAVGSRYGTDFEGATFETPDPQTIKVTFEKAYPAFIPASLAFRPGLIVSPKAMQEKGDQWKTSPVGSGPFEWSKLEPGTSLTLKRFEGYWGQKPKIDQIFYKFKLDDKSSVLAVAKGELDAIYIDDPDVALDVSKNTDPNTIFIKAEKGQGVYWIAYNMNNKPLDDIKVRQALNYAIDIDSIANDLFGGLAQPLHSILPPFMWGYTDDVMKYDYNPEKAKQMLKEANVDLGSWQPSMIGDGSTAIARKVHEAVGSFWQDVGVKVKVDTIEYGVFLERRYAGNYDMFGISVGRIEPDTIATPYWKSGSRANQSYYSAADDLIDQAKSEPDVTKRAALYKQLQQKIAQDAPAAFIISTASPLLVNKRVAGLSGAGWQGRFDWFNVDVPAE